MDRCHARVHPGTVSHRRNAARHTRFHACRWRPRGRVLFAAAGSSPVPLAAEWIELSATVGDNLCYFWRRHTGPGRRPCFREQVFELMQTKYLLLHSNGILLSLPSPRWEKDIRREARSYQGSMRLYSYPV